ncbi:MAG: 50S ribosomal protein L10 [bacterium]
MPKTKIQKSEILRSLSEKIKKANSIVFAKFDGLTVKENEELRKQLKAENSEYYVAKKTLFDLSFKDSNIKDLNIKDLEGRIAAIFGFGDEVMPAKIVGKFKKDHEEKISFAGGILENKFISEKEVDSLSKLPSKKELYAKLVGSLNSPVSGFVNCLTGNLRGLVNVLKAIEKR